MSNNQYLALDDQDERNENKKKMSDWRSLVYLLKFAKGNYLFLILALVILISFSVLSLLSSRLTGELVDKGLLELDAKKATSLAISVVLLEIFALLSNYYGRLILSTRASLVILNIRKKLFTHLQSLPLSFFDRWPQGRVITRMTHDVEGLEEFFTSSLGRLVSSTFMAIMAMVAMFTTDVTLSIYLVASVVPALVFVYLTRTKVKNINRKMSRLSSDINSKLTEYIDGLAVIRSFGLEGWSMNKYQGTINQHISASLEANFLHSWSRPLLSLLCSAPLLVLAYMGGSRVLEGTLSVGLFVAFIRYCERFFFPIMNLFREIHVIFQAFTSAERVANFLEFDTEDTVFKKNDILLKDNLIEGHIEFKNVSMSYEVDKWVLKDITFDIAKGKCVGLVGTTGCGKTTTISLLSRLYEFQKGAIFIDGHDLRSFDRSKLRSQIGVVSQDAIIFQGTLRQNLSLDPKKTDDQILKLARETGLLKVMNESSLDLDSVLLDGGANLSVGQKQLICLCRIFLTDPAILILDEATANIDPTMEKIIHTALLKLMKDRTTLMIAHRLETIENCDELLVFEKGEIIEKGPPAKLIEEKGYFYKLKLAGQKREES